MSGVHFVAIVSRSKSPWLDWTSGAPHTYLPWRKILEHIGSGTDYSSLPDCDTGRNEHVGCNPSPRSNDNRLRDEWEVHVLMVVGGTTEIRILAHHCVIANLNTADVVDINVGADT